MARLQSLGVSVAVFAWVIDISVVNASQVWNGPTISYTQPGTDPTKAANQDRITAHVWLTRAASRGIFNAVTESGYVSEFSPQDTEWAYGTLDNYATLTYQPWELWNGRNPPSMVGHSAVVHLISDNIYLALTFTSWGGGAGGRFAYTRTTESEVDSPLFNPLTICLTAVAIGGMGGYHLLRRQSFTV